MRIFCKGKKKFFAYLFVLPVLVLLTIILIIPTVLTVAISFCSWHIVSGEKLRYVGVKGYVDTLVDPAFWSALRVTMLLVAACVFLELVGGLVIALLLTQGIKSKRKGLVRTVFLLPYLISPVVVGLQWRWLYNFHYGLINYVLRKIGLPALAWLANSSTVLPAIIIADVWQWTPFATLFLSAGLLAIPKELYEAAKIDGASALSMFKNITLPLLKSVILIVLVMRSIFSFRMFDKIYVLTGGGPANASTNLGILMYKKTFEFWYLGRAAVLGGIMCGIGILMGIFYVKLVKIE